MHCSISFISLALLLSACSGDTLEEVPPVGKVDGYVCNTETDSLAAFATVSGQGVLDIVSTETDETGFFTLRALEVGPQTLTITGASNSFTDTVEVTVVEDVTTRLPDPYCLAPPAGAVEGLICAVESELGSGEGYYLADARVWITVDAIDYETQTDSTGFFRLSDVPAGNRVLQVEKGSFNASEEVIIRPDETTVLDYVCLEPTTPLLVVTGEFDSIHEILMDLGYQLRWCEKDSLDTSCPLGDTVNEAGNITLYDGLVPNGVATFMNGDDLSDFDVIFFNCGVAMQFISNSPPGVGENLSAFVRNGGSLYVSDWAYEIITDMLDSPPTGDPALDFHDSTPSAPPPPPAGVGLPGDITARVEDEALVTITGTTVDIGFDKASWVVLEPTQEAGINVLVQADVQVDYDKDGTADGTLAAAPLLVTMPYGDGRIVFTSFHNEAQVSEDMQEILRFLVFEL